MRKRIAALLATFALAFCLPICTPAAFAASAFDQGGSSMAAAGIESDVTYNAGNLFAVMHPVSNTDIEERSVLGRANPRCEQSQRRYFGPW